MSKAKIVATVKKPIFRHLYGEKRVVADKGYKMTFRRVAVNRYLFGGGIYGTVYLTKKELSENLNMDEKELFVLLLMT